MTEHRKQCQAAWLQAFRFFRYGLGFPVGRARYYARMRVDQDLKASRA